MRIVAIIIQPPRLLDTVPGLFSRRTVAWSDSCRSCPGSTLTSPIGGPNLRPGQGVVKRR